MHQGWPPRYDAKWKEMNSREINIIPFRMNLSRKKVRWDKIKLGWGGVWFYNVSPYQGLNACPLHWKHGVLTTEVPGKSYNGVYLRDHKSSKNWSFFWPLVGWVAHWPFARAHRFMVSGQGTSSICSHSHDIWNGCQIVVRGGGV